MSIFRFDESDPQFLIVYTGTDEPQAADLQRAIRRWMAWLDDGRRFGVILVSEPHEHKHDAHGREQEAATTKTVNDFRRDYRMRNNRQCWGYANVVFPDTWDKPPGDDLAAWDEMQDDTERFAAYTFGVHGCMVMSVDEAKAWLGAQAARPPLSLNDTSPADAGGLSSQRVGLFYGSTTGVTEYAAERIAQAWQATSLEPLHAVNIGAVEHLAGLLAFDYLILGIPTWNVGQLQDDWEVRVEQLDALDFSHTRVALFGVGDQVNYPDNFLDALGVLARKLRERGATLAGAWPAGGYTFDASLASEAGALLGLGIDDVNQPDQTEDRVARWVAQVVDEWRLTSHPIAPAPAGVTA